MNITKHTNKIALTGLFSCALAGALALEGWLYANSIEQRQHLRAGSCHYCLQNKYECYSPEILTICSTPSEKRPYCREEKTGYNIEKTQAPNGNKNVTAVPSFPKNCPTTDGMLECVGFIWGININTSGKVYSCGSYNDIYTVGPPCSSSNH